MIEQEVIAEISESLVNRYQTGLETSVRDLWLYYYVALQGSSNKISFKPGGSINPFNYDDKWF